MRNCRTGRKFGLNEQIPVTFRDISRYFGFLFFLRRQSSNADKILSVQSVLGLEGHMRNLLVVFLLVVLLLPPLSPCQSPATERNKAQFEGQVINSITGELVRKARLTLRMNVAIRETGRQQHEAPASVPITVLSDAAGKFEFTDLDPGSYQLQVRRDGFANVQLGIKGAGRMAEPIILGRGDHKAGFTVKMTPYSVISGRITEEDGDPVRGMPVAVMTYQYTSKGRELVDGRSASTNDLGEYRIYDIPPGKYFLRASPGPMRSGVGPEDTESYAPVYYPGAPDSAGAAPLELAAGQQVTGFNFTLRKVRYAIVRGKVIAPPGASGLSVGRMIVTDHSTSSSSSSITDKDGKFQMFGVAPGLIYLTGSYTLDSRRHSALLPLHVQSSDISGIELRPIPPVDVTGRVHIEGSSDTKPAPAQITLQGPGMRHAVEPSMIRDGRVAFMNVEPNVYRVTADRMGKLYLKSIRWGDTDITDAELDLTAGAPPRTELTVVFGADSGEIEGTVKDEKSEPVESATVTLVPAGSRRARFLHKSAPTNATGGFKIQGVAPGSYKLFAWDKVDPNAVIFDPEFLRPYEGSGQNVEISAHDRKSFELKLILTR
jgi:protocatechuate 3,4-dioxygenase beta subunit